MWRILDFLLYSDKCGTRFSPKKMNYENVNTEESQELIQLTVVAPGVML